MTVDRSPRFAFTAHEDAYYAGELAGVALRGARVLEIGFGHGGLLAWLRDRGAEVVGVEADDVSSRAAAAAGYEIRSADLWTWADGEAGSFDLVVGIDVLEHLDADQIARTLSAVALLLRSGGTAVFRFPNGQSPFGRVWQYGDPTHRSVLSGPVLAVYAEQGGLELAQASDAYQPAPLTPVIGRAIGGAVAVMRSICSALLRRLYGLGHVPLGANLTVRLRKP